MTQDFDYLGVAKSVIRDEMSSLLNLSEILDAGFVEVCTHIQECKGRIIFMGVGQSWHVARKTACSMASLGKPAFYVHATEAVHGDMGLITPEDVVILISHSGETKEVLAALGPIGAIGASTVALVGDPDSSLARACNYVMTTGVKEEAGPIKFAPSSSALTTTALGDALVMVIASAIGFTEEDYSKCHPGGAIGERLLGSDSI